MITLFEEAFAQHSLKGVDLSVIKNMNDTKVFLLQNRKVVGNVVDQVYGEMARSKISLSTKTGEPANPLMVIESAGFALGCQRNDADLPEQTGISDEFWKTPTGQIYLKALSEFHQETDRSNFERLIFFLLQRGMLNHEQGSSYVQKRIDVDAGTYTLVRDRIVKLEMSASQIQLLVEYLNDIYEYQYPKTYERWNADEVHPIMTQLVQSLSKSRRPLNPTVVSARLRRE